MFLLLWTAGDTHTGAVLGHEICGVVDVIGKEVPIDCPLKVGYTVIVYPWRGCRQCEVRINVQNLLRVLCVPFIPLTCFHASFFLVQFRCFDSLYRPYVCNHTHAGTHTRMHTRAYTQTKTRIRIASFDHSLTHAHTNLRRCHAQ